MGKQRMGRRRSAIDTVGSTSGNLPIRTDYSSIAPSGLAIDLRDVTFAYEGGTRALDRLSLAVPQGEFTALVGPNGGGKSTLARHLNGLLRPRAGSVAINGRPAAGRPVGDLAREVGYVSQNPDHQIFAPTVREEVAFGPRNLGLKGDALARRVDEALAAFDLEALAGTPPAVLGYGQRRLVTVASVWAMQPPIWVLDEPTTGLDARFTARLMACLHELHRAGATILLITHDLRLVAEAAQRVVVIDAGRVAVDGPPAVVLSDPQALATHGLRPPPITRLSAALAPFGFPHPVLTVDQFMSAWHGLAELTHALRPLRPRQRLAPTPRPSHQNRLGAVWRGVVCRRQGRMAVGGVAGRHPRVPAEFQGAAPADWMGVAATAARGDHHCGDLAVFRPAARPGPVHHWPVQRDLDQPAGWRGDRAAGRRHVDAVFRHPVHHPAARAGARAGASWVCPSSGV